MNAYASAVRFYQHNDIDTASPVHLVVLLYDGAIRFFRLSAKAQAEGKKDQARDYLLRAEKIILELLCTLNLEKGGEIAQNLADLYRFIIGRCGTLNDENYGKVIEENCRLLAGLRESWAQIERASDGRESR
ncbi:MAG: flagellar export chaperone FliS [Candidatus Caldatribacteriaceae bacterium]